MKCRCFLKGFFGAMSFIALLALITFARNKWNTRTLFVIHTGEILYIDENNVEHEGLDHFYFVCTEGRAFKANELDDNKLHGYRLIYPWEGNRSLNYVEKTITIDTEPESFGQFPDGLLP